jgi:hypothetical protein
MGVVGATLAGEARISQSIASRVAVREARLEQTAVAGMAAVDVTLERATAVGILIAGRVNGSVRPVLDWRGALAFGAAFGLVVGLLRRR